jgi:DNA-binding CsgD family transcriptional regulator
MPVEGNEQIFRAITPRQLELLRLLSVERRHARLAALMRVSVATVRTHIRALCELTDCHGTDELWDWWRENADSYAKFVAFDPGNDRSERSPHFLTMRPSEISWHTVPNFSGERLAMAGTRRGAARILGLMGALMLLLWASQASAHHFDNMFKTLNANWNCSDWGPNPNGQYCQNDNANVTYCFETSISTSGKSTINSVLSNEYAPTDLSVTFESSCDYSGGSETDIVFQYRTDLPSGAAGMAWCDDSNNSTQCDQHYNAFNTSGPSYDLVCHEIGHAMGLTHGPQAYPAQADNTAALGCMGNASGYQGSLGSHNATQINSTY